VEHFVSFEVGTEFINSEREWASLDELRASKING
jgi:hypothetical protein